MDNFKQYADYYNLLYRDKDYAGETDYIDQCLRKFANVPPKSILNLGCGTGRHDTLLMHQGYRVCGVDLSENMIALARSQDGYVENNSLDFQIGDVRDLDLGTKFDAVVSLFHVASYQTSNSDLRKFFETARKHLDDGSIFLFDCWYGPGVLSDKPVRRTKSVQGEEFDIERIAEPVMHVSDNIVDVNYTIQLHYADGQTAEIRELHRMRYLFNTEIEIFASGLFEIVHSEEWMSGNPLTLESWNALFILRAS